MNTDEYRHQIKRARGDCAFTWGAVRNALLLECRSGRRDLITKLCFSEETVVKEMMVIVLRDYALEDSKFVQGILNDLLLTRDSWIRTLFRAKLGQSEQQHDPTYNAQRIAIEVASELVLVDLLVEAMRNPSSTVRGDAVRYTFYLWLRDHLRGSEALKSLANNAVLPGGLPHVRVLESCLGLSFLILQDVHAHDSDEGIAGSRTVLAQVWRQIIEQLLVGSGGWFPAWTRTKILEIGIKLAISLTREVPKYNPTNVREFDYFFHLPAGEKAAFKRQLAYLTTDTIDMRAAEREMVEAIGRRDAFSAFVMGYTLILQGINDPEAVLPTMKELWATALTQKPLGPAMGQIPFALYSIERQRGEFDPVIHEMHKEFIKNFLDRSHGVWFSPVARCVTVGLDGIIIGDYEVYQREGKSELVQYYIELAIQEPDKEFLKDILWFLSNLRHESRYFRPLLANIAPLLSYQDEDIQLSLVRLLAHMRFYREDDIEEYMAEQQLSEDFINRVRSVEQNEKIGGDIIWSSAIFGFGDLFINLFSNPDTSPYLISIMNYVVDAKDLRDWAIYTTKVVVNLVYGDTIFDVGQNSFDGGSE